MNRYYVVFHKAFDALIRDFKKNKGLLEDKRLSFCEKQILKAHLAIRDNKYNDAFSLMEDCTPINEYFEAHQKLLLGLALNNIGQSQKALQFLEDAIHGFHHDLDYYFIFLLYRNAFVCALNLNNHSKIEKYKNLIEKMDTKTKRLEILQKMTILNYYITKDDIFSCKKIIEDMSAYEKDLSGSDLPAYLISKFNFAMISDNFDLGHQVLNELKKVKKFHLTENYKFMNSLLHFVSSNDPIYLRDEDLERVPVLQYQAMCIKKLSENNTNDAQKYWDKLKSISSQTYQDQFIYQGPKYLFYHCLNRLKPAVKQVQITIPENLSYLERLDYILKSEQTVMSKETLYELIWQEPCQDKDHLKKLARLLYKYKQSHPDLKIQSIHGGYSWETPKKAS